jgi:hypothetical protein
MFSLVTVSLDNGQGQKAGGKPAASPSGSDGPTRWANVVARSFLDRRSGF